MLEKRSIYILKYKQRRTSSDSFTFILKKRFPKSHKHRPEVYFQGSDLPENPTLFLEVLVICATFLLWTTSVVMLIFSVFLMLQQYFISMLTDAYDFFGCMTLQMVASLVLAVTASFVCACHNPRYSHVPLLAKWAISFLVISMIILSAEIALAIYYKWFSNIHLESKMQWKLKYSINHQDILDEWDVMHKTLSCCGVDSQEDWIKLGQPIPKSCCRKFQGDVCLSWVKRGCLGVYTLVKSKFLSFLTGSASISLANCLIVIPVLVRLLLVTTRLTRDSRKLRKIKKYTKRIRQPPIASVSYFAKPYVTPDASSTALVTILDAKKKQLEVKIAKQNVKFADETLFKTDDDSIATPNTSVMKDRSEDIILFEDLQTKTTESSDPAKPSTSAK